MTREEEVVDSDSPVMDQFNANLDPGWMEVMINFDAAQFGVLWALVEDAVLPKWSIHDTVLDCACTLSASGGEGLNPLQRLSLWTAALQTLPIVRLAFDLPPPPAGFSPNRVTLSE
ncbi:TPA: hypothetical protein N0F65_006075 [Lagenidium giganteum]|uniref:Uncharacterized protein n=1 Tax=Lagenidium giganteum TaxID=4803 RepID=A0AAV2YQD3_9STRA|nr:TPA: hypothetical protein N0F65_006075 [Lagenidium giganteum]